MAEALAISAANLDIIEKNLNAVAHELSGVMNNVSTVNSQVNNVEAKVESLNDEVKGLVKEIRETTIMTNARQSIMYNNEQIDKKFGYYDSVRRTTEALISAVEKSNISKSSLIKLRQDLILNNPNYWLANALACLTSWILNDRENSEKELNNALKLNSERTSIFFCLVNYRFKRYDTSINWLNRYLQNQDPSNLDKDFVTVLDLIATGTFGDEAKVLVLNKIQEWFRRLSSNQNIREQAIAAWEQYIDDNEEKNVTMPYIELYCTNSGLLKNNLVLTSSYASVLNNLDEITKKNYSNKDIDTILNNLIYNYEEKESIYQSDNLKNNLILECNGNREEAEELFRKQQQIYSEKVDLVNLLTNISIYHKEYKVSNETQKMALSLSKPYIKEAFNKLNSKIFDGDINIKINNFQTKTKDGLNRDEIANDLSIHVNKEFNYDGKDLIITLLIINILGIIGIFITLKSRVLSTLLIILLVLGDLYLLYKLHKKTTLNEESKKILSRDLNNTLERITAEVIDYKNMLNGDKEMEKNLMVFLDSLKTEDFINSNSERNIEIGE